MNKEELDGYPALIRDRDGLTVSLDERMTTIGSAPRCRIVLSDREAPAHCAHILFSEGKWSVSVVSDALAVQYNGQLIDGPTDLSEGDAVQFGSETWRFTDGIVESQGDSAAETGIPLHRFVRALANYSRTGDSDARFELLAGMAQLLLADGARLVSEDGRGDYVTIARYPKSSGLDRFSMRAIAWAREKKTTILMHETDWADEGESKGSLELNRVGSVLCVPLYEGREVRGYLYVDRCTSRNAFAENDRKMLDGVAPVFADLLALYEQAQLQRDKIEALQKEIAVQQTPIVFECDAMHEAIGNAVRFGATDSTVLITGETGTGKELFARFIHRHSNRTEHGFCAVNCGALPENLIESELFGHEKGAFTGAHQRRKGLFERAQGGTVFLDEIGEIPLNLQVKLLRALQESEILPLGGTAPVPIDARIVAATNRNLQEEVRLGRFREDLYYRLNVLEINIPPLRNRHRDVLLLANCFIKKYAARFGIPEKGISLPAQAKLLACLWPGNIRQLENVIQKALLVSTGSLLLDTDIGLPEDVASLSGESAGEDDAPCMTLKDARSAAEKKCITIALSRSSGNITVAARLLNTDRKWLTKLMKQYGLTADRDRG